jgi:hypothetical protein
VLGVAKKKSQQNIILYFIFITFIHISVVVGVKVGLTGKITPLNDLPAIQVSLIKFGNVQF